VVRSLFYNSPPLGLAYLASTLEARGDTVTITDCPVERLTTEELPARAAQLKPDLIGLTATTTYFDTARESARQLRLALPDVPIVLGGPHINANPDALLDEPAFTLAALGEGEITLREIAARIEAQQPADDVPGVVRPVNGSLRFAVPRPFLDDLDALPLPARHLLPLRRYRPMPNDQHRLPKTAMISSRGCPFACTFCDKSIFGTRYRSHGPDRIVAEMHELTERHGVRDIAFVDSTFTPNRARVERVLDAMAANPPRATWTCSCRANVLDEDLLRRMRALGCWRVRVGIESGNEEILASICKGITKQDVADTVRLADRLGFRVKAFFIVGHPGETRRTIEDSISFALSLPITDVTVQINTPLRGTPQFAEAARHGTFTTDDRRQYSFFQPVFVPHGMTADELLAAHRRFYRRFYLRASVVWRHLKHIRRWSDVSKHLRAAPLVFNLLFAARGRA
jgi:radical SAM superfamily enzyme YgiQ (UPF0313 family)